jgi:hypothetical protein
MQHFSARPQLPITPRELIEISLTTHILVTVAVTVVLRTKVAGLGGVAREALSSEVGQILVILLVHPRYIKP